LYSGDAVALFFSSPDGGGYFQSIALCPTVDGGLVAAGDSFPGCSYYTAIAYVGRGCTSDLSGNLGIPVRISGDDEVAQLGSAFEQMRLRLRARLTDLSLLLNISQSVSATLDLDEGVPLILKGALDETEAAVARFVLLNNGSDQPQGVFAVGLADATFPGLDRAFALALSHRRDPLVNQNLLQPRVGESTPGAGGCKAWQPSCPHTKSDGGVVVGGGVAA
jgi:hypothetical protein